MIRYVPKKGGFIRTALAVAVGVPFLIGTSAYAQAVEAAPTATPANQAAGAPATTGSGAPNTAQQGGSAETERIIVTGSNIPTAEEVGPNPVLNINRDLINKSGARNSEELLRDLPVANANGVPVSNNATGFTPGASSISLRGFDPSATLVLIDGRRVAPYPVGTGGTQAFIDLNTIPRAAIERIEVLKDGASTTYGADAVAGVVNIIFRKNYRGAEATIEYGNTLDKDSGESAADLIFGVGDDKTQVTGVINYYRRNSIANRDRGFSAKPPFVSSNASPINLQLSRAAVILAGGTPPSARATFFGTPPNGANGFAPASTYIYANRRPRGAPPAPIPGFNFNQFSLSYPETERYGGYLSASHKICGDQLVLYADMFYQDVKTHNELAPSATGSFQTPGQTTLFIPPRTPAATVGGPSAATVGAPPGAFNPFNPFQQFISGGSRYRLAEFGNRLFDNESDAFLTTVGVKGDKLFDGTWGYDVGFRYSQIKNTSTGRLQSSTLFDRVLNANDPIFNPASNQFIGTTIPYNPFADFHNPPASNAATVNFATVHPKDIDISKLGTIDATIYTTSLFKLPAGGVGFAAGAQFRRENEEQDPDQLNVTGDIIGSSKTAITHAGRKDYAFYAETDIPIFSPEMNVIGFRALNFTAAAREEEFLNNDTNVLVPKIGVRWQPLDDSLTLRATWGEGFREPSLYELFSGPTNGLVPTRDPQNNNIFESETPFTTNSSPGLQPEDSRALSAGFVYTPKYVNGLTVSVDVWGIERTGVVQSPSAQQVLNREAAGTLQPTEGVDRDAGGLIARVFTSFQNAGQERARGVDLGLQYAYQTSRFGTFTSLTQATYLDSFRFALLQGNPAIEVAGTSIGSSEDAYLKWKGQSRLDWAWKSLDVNLTCRYTDGFHEINGTGASFPDNKKEHWVHQTFFFDTQATYDFTFAPPVENAPVSGYSKGGKEMVRGKDGKTVEPTQTANYTMPCWKNLLNNTSFTIGCNNVFGQDPPKAVGAFGNSVGYPSFIYDSTGRFVYGSITHKF